MNRVEVATEAAAGPRGAHRWVGFRTIVIREFSASCASGARPSCRR